MLEALPKKIDLKKTKGLTIEWADGEESFYSLEYLRRMCPCATCRTARGDSPKAAEESPNPPQEPEKSASKRTSLTVLAGDFSRPLTVDHAEMVGNYAIRIEWSDKHSTGIYSYLYLREISQ